MNEFNLKKRNVRRRAYFDKNNLLAKNGSSLINDNGILKNARLDAQKIIKEDFELSHSQNRNINQFFYKKYSKMLKWSSVS